MWGTAVGSAPAAVLLLGILIAALFAAAPSAQATPSSGKALYVTALPATVRKALDRAEDDNNVGLAVLDSATGAYYGSPHATRLYPSESVVKVLIAAKLLATGKMTGSTDKRAYRMITQSDDEVADDLWGVVGGPAVINWASDYFDVPDLGAPPTSYGYWGNTNLPPRAWCGCWWRCSATSASVRG